MNNILLDTDIISYFFRGVPQITQQIEQYLQANEEISFSVITYYEVCNGLYYKDAKNQLVQFKKFASLCTVLPLTQEITDLAAKVFADLRKKRKVCWAYGYINRRNGYSS